MRDFELPVRSLAVGRNGMAATVPPDSDADRDRGAEGWRQRG
jgi:hypothetical protein